MRVLVVTNMYPTPRAPASGTFVEQQIQGLKQIGLEVEVLFLDRLQEGMGIYRSVGRKVASRIKHFEPDLVHIMYGGVMADLVTKAVTHRPTVVTFHGSDLLGEHLSGFLRKLIASFGVYASWRAARRANGIIVVSKFLQDTLPKYVNPSKVRIVPCGIDLERFKLLDQHICCDRLGWDTNCFNILFNGNNDDPVKRPSLAQGAADALRRLGVHAQLHALRSVSNDDVPFWLNASDVILLTSLHEGSPTIIKEALACNLPIVSVDVGDVRERIQGVEGCFIALPNTEDLAAKLALVHSGPDRVAGRQKIQELSLKSIALRLKAFYSEILNSSPTYKGSLTED